MGLTRLAISRPVTILMLVLALVILGLQSRGRLPVDLYPDVEFPIVVISTIYTGTGPEEIETLVSKPIEDAVSSISNLKKLTSTSSEGVSTVVMEFELGTEIDTATADVRSKLDALRNALPDDAEAPVVIKADIGAMPIISLSVASTRRSPIELRQMADDIVKDRLGQLSGVASVTVSGGDVREVRVEVDKNRLEAYGLSISQVVNALQAENLNVPSGSIEESRRTSAIRVMGEFTKPNDILHVRLASGSNPDLTIADVANVRDTVAKAASYTRVDREPSVTLTVQKQTDANTVKVVDGVRKELEKLTGETYTQKTGLQAMMEKGMGKPTPLLSDDVQITVAMDQSTFIKETLTDVNKSLVEGALLAIIIVFLFLHSVRGTLIVSLAIPTSMIATFLVMELMGFSINMMSMLGLSLCVGILVDDSIVVLENIHRHLRAGLSPKDAAIKGRSEIGLAALTITFVDVVVFVPVAFMGGIVGQFFRQFGIVVAAATLFSLFVSFTLTPMLASRWLKPHDAEEEEAAKQQHNPGLFHRFTTAWERHYGKLETFYRNLLAWSLDHRAVVISLGLMTILTSVTVSMPKPTLGKLLISLPLMAIGIGVMCMVWTFLPRITPAIMRTLYLVLLPLVAVALAWPIVKNSHGQIGKAAGAILVILVVVCVIMFLATKLIPRASIGVLRFLYSLPALAVSLVFATLVPKITHAGTPMITMLMMLAMIGVIGYAFALPMIGSPPTGKKVNALRPIIGMVTTLAVIVLIIPGSFAVQFQPQVDERAFSVKVEQEVGTSLDVTNQTAEMIEHDLFDTEIYPETKTVFSTTGSSGSGGMFGGSSTGTDQAQLNVELKDMDDVDLPSFQRQLIAMRMMRSPLRRTDEVMRAINERYKDLPGVKVTAAVEGGGPGGTPVDIEVSGANQAQILRVAEQIEQVVKETKGTYSAQLSWRQGRPEIQARIDRDRAAQYGMSVAQIASALRTSLEGDTSTKFRENGKEYEIRVFLPEQQRDNTSQLSNMVIGTTSGGNPVYLYEVATLEPAAGPTKVERSNRQRSVSVQAQLREGAALGTVRKAIDERIAGIDTTGLTITWAGQAEAMDDSFTNMFNAMGLSVALVFMLMAALFESFLSPLIIMLSVPQAMAGAIFAISITHKPLDIVTMIGIIMLVGLVTKNAILLVDYTNTLRHAHGMSRREALLQAGPTRLRPILMTTLAMIFGMMPTALALSKGSEFRQPMAIVVIGGLFVSMFLTLIMVPSFYEILDDMGQRFGHAKDAIIRRLRV